MSSNNKGNKNTCHRHYMMWLIRIVASALAIIVLALLAKYFIIPGAPTP